MRTCELNALGRAIDQTLKLALQSNENLVAQLLQMAGLEVSIQLEQLSNTAEKVQLLKTG